MDCIHWCGFDGRVAWGGLPGSSRLLTWARELGSPTARWSSVSESPASGTKSDWGEAWSVLRSVPRDWMWTIQSYWRSCSDGTRIGAEKDWWHLGIGEWSLKDKCNIVGIASLWSWQWGRGARSLGSVGPPPSNKWSCKCTSLDYPASLINY